jgi:hypothetical protein
MRVYHICTPDTAQMAARHCITYHWRELPNGKALLSSEFKSAQAQARFEQHVTVTPLPSVLDPAPLAAEHVANFAHIGVHHGHTMRDLVTIVKKELHCLL